MGIPRGLLLQRLAQLVEQPRVLDRDHCLVGEGRDEFNLPVGEWPYGVSPQSDESNW
jgi:hypothetical protein